MTMRVKLVESDAELEKVCGVLLQLRNAFDREGLIRQVAEQRRGGYQLAYVESGGVVLCVAGFAIATKLAWGTHLYVDDFVTDDRHRRSGAGARLMDWLKAHARERGCREIHLDSGVSNFAAHGFYLRQGFHIASHHFAIRSLAPSELGSGPAVPSR
jgi:GNAT superfamily N-acetyltransferase